MNYTFERTEERTIFLWDYGWFEVTTYQVPELEIGYKPNDIFNSFFQHTHYGRSYITPERSERTWPGRGESHGPFVRDRITPDNMLALSQEEFLAQLGKNLNKPYMGNPPHLGEPAQDDQQNKVFDVVKGLFSVASDYYKLDIERHDEQYRHELWWILVCFYE